MSINKSNSKLKEFFSIIMSGVTGALALNGICIVLFLIGFGYRNEFISSLYQKTFARCSLQGLFITASSVGFIIGLIVRRRFLNWKNEIVLIAAFSVPLIVGAWLIYTYASYVTVVRNLKLADCTNSVTSIHLKAPRGHDFRFTLAAPSGTTNIFSGRIEILDGKSTVTNFPIGIQQAEQQCDFLRGQTNYDINIFFDQQPPQPTSIWLYWKEGYKDRHG